MRRHEKVRDEYAALANDAAFCRRFALVRRMANLRCAAGDPGWQEPERPAIRLAERRAV